MHPHSQLTNVRTFSPERVESGIRNRQNGYEARVRVNGQIRTKRFSLSTPLAAIRSWRELQRQDARFQRALLHQQARAPKRSLAGWCYIYFVRAGAFVKIGRAIDVAQRLRNMKSAHPDGLTLLVAVPGHASLESAFHTYFEKARHNGEWYHTTDELLLFIRQMQAGRNPVALLFDGADLLTRPANLLTQQTVDSEQ